jgi:hypothetical protein
VRRGEKVDHYETVRQRKDGSLVNISLTVSPIRNAQGEIVGASKIAATSQEPGGRRSGKSFSFGKWTIASRISSRSQSAFYA